MGAGEVRKPWQQPGEGRRPSDLAKGVPSGIIQSRSPRRAAAVPGHHRGQDGPRPISTESSLSGQGSQKATETQARATCSWCQEGTNGAEWRLAFLGAHGGLAGEVWGPPHHPALAPQRQGWGKSCSSLEGQQCGRISDPGYDGELREPLLWRQGSQVSMCVARGCVSFL